MTRAHYDRDDIIQALLAGGLAVGDTAIFSTGLGTLGVAQGVTSLEQLNELFLDCIKEVMGPTGTILAPAYSYTFGPSTINEPAQFDPISTPPTIGPFPEFFSRQPGVQRTWDPMMSICGLGPACDELFDDLPSTSFGQGCIFDRLTGLNVKCCNIGLGPNWTPFNHYVDWLKNTPYRYDKLFVGEAVQGGEVSALPWVFSVRIQNQAGRADTHRLGKLATEAGIWKYVPLGRGRVYTANYKDYFDFACENVDQDPWLLAYGPPGDPRRLDEECVPPKRWELPAPLTATVTQNLETLLALPRDTVSDGMDATLEALGHHHEITVHEYPSGTNCYDWVVPEKWACHAGQLIGSDGKILLDYDKDHLSVTPYSISFSGSVSDAELKKHLHTRLESPLFDQNFMARDWGFSIPDDALNNLSNDHYDVQILTSRIFGHMKAGEIIVPGQTDETVLICTYLQQTAEEPETLSGALIALDAVKKIQSGKTPKLSYRLLLLPGPVGLAAWMNSHESLLPKISSAIALKNVSQDANLSVQYSDAGNTRADQICGRLLPDVSTGWNMFPSGGNPVHKDKSDWALIPMTVLSRSRPQGHSKRDDARIVKVKPHNDTIIASRDFLDLLIENLEA
ncbi:MAG: DUF4910 domain-containing protein [Rhodospirillales bacterium]|nr:DUF4910 domain-containing protein [Rhodospirillales bacterium]